MTTLDWVVVPFAVLGLIVLGIGIVSGFTRNRSGRRWREPLEGLLFWLAVLVVELGLLASYLFLGWPS